MPVIMRIRAVLVCTVLLSGLSFAQNWKQVHKQDEIKWAKETGLDPSTIHKLWRAASRAADENADDSRIANIDLDGLAERHDVLLVTYAGEKNCLTLTVFRQFSEVQFEKIWSAGQSPDGAGFCDTNFGNAKAYAENGMVLVRVPHVSGEGTAGYQLYSYVWKGITYRLADKKSVPPQ